MPIRFNKQIVPGTGKPGDTLREYGIDPDKYKDEGQPPETEEPPPQVAQQGKPPYVWDAELKRFISGPIRNSTIPDPNALRRVSPARPGNQFTMRGARNGDPEPYIFGKCLADPLLIAADDSGSYLYMDVLWSVGEIDALEALYYDNIDEGNREFTGIEEHFEGTAGQAASTIMTSLKGSYDTLANKAHSVIIAIRGLSVNARIRGIKCTDPRNSPATAVYTTNPALCLARVLVDLGYTMNWASVSSAANYCDELIGSPGVKRWEIGGQITGRTDAADIIKTMAAYANCFVDRIGDEVYLTADKPRAANHTVTAADMIRGTVKVSRDGGRNVPDSVTVTGRTVEGKEISYTYGTPGSAGTNTTLRMPFYQNCHMLGRKAEETYLKARTNLTLEFVGFDDGIQRTVGDIGTVTNAQFGISAVTMTLIENEQIGRGRWRKKYVQYSASNYSDQIYTCTTNDYSLGNPNSPPDGPTPILSEQVYTDVAGVTRSRFRIIFYGIAAWAYLDNYYVTCIGDDGLIILETNKSSLGENIPHTLYTTGEVRYGVEYTVSVYVRSNTGALGDPGTATITSTQGNGADLNEGDLTNMHVYVLDGDARYATTSQKTGSPQLGETWASRFSASPIPAWSAGETWLGNQICETVFQTEVWDSGNTWSGGWKFTDLDITTLGGASKGPFVSLSAAVSPLSFTDYSGVLKSGTEARYMKAKAVVTDSPLSAGDGLHVKLPIPVQFLLGD